MKLGSERRRIGLLALSIALVGACSSPQGTEAPDNSLLGKKEDGRGAGSKERPKGSGGRAATKKGRAGAAAMASAGVVAPQPGETPAIASGAAKTETKVAASGTDPRTASMLVTEPDPDTEKSGITPEYADIVSTRLEGTEAELEVTIAFRAALPEKMPDDKTYMIGGFGLSSDDREQGYAFGVSANTKGWTAYGGSAKSGQGRKFPGTYSVSGTTIVMRLPWSAIGGARPFEWYSQASWFRSLAGTTHYSLDMLPNDGPARFPAG